MPTIDQMFTQGSTPSPSFSGADAGAADPNGTNPLSGFAARYDPSQLENIWQTPWAILPDVFKGMNTAGPGYQSMRDMGADPLTLYNIMAGFDSNLAGDGTGGYTNWLANLYKSRGSVGGRQFSAKELLHQLFNPVQPGPTAEPGDKNSALYNILTAGDGATQMRTLFNMFRDATDVGMNPLAAKGAQSALARTGDAAINQMMKTGAGQGANNMPVYQLIRQLAPGLMT